MRVDLALETLKYFLAILNDPCARNKLHPVQVMFFSPPLHPILCSYSVGVKSTTHNYCGSKQYCMVSEKCRLQTERKMHTADLKTLKLNHV